MAWPNSRLTTYAPGMPVKSADLNALQDAIIWPRHGSRKVFVGPGAALSNMTSGGSYYLAGSGEAGFHLPMTAGDRVTGIKVFLRDTNGTALSVRMVDVDLSAAPYAISEARTPVTSDASGDDQSLELSEDLPYAVIETTHLVVQCFDGGASKRLYGIVVTFDRP